MCHVNIGHPQLHKEKGEKNILKIFLNIAFFLKTFAVEYPASFRTH